MNIQSWQLDAYNVEITRISRILDMCPNLKTHMLNVHNLSCKLGAKLGLNQKELLIIGTAALNHDIGKIKIPKKILNKPGPLTENEMNIMKRHSILGAEILKRNDYSKEIVDAVRQHHERVDGTGYPNGLKDNEISIFAKIIAIADAYDAMTTSRTYQKALSAEEAFEEINKYRDTQFNWYITEMFIRTVL